MHPILLTLPLFGYTLEIPTYGVMLAVAFLIILKAAAVLARREGLEARDVVDLGFTVFLAGLVGAKLLLILLDIRHYLANPGDLLGTLRSAGVFYGGLLAAVPAGIWFARLPVGTSAAWPRLAAAVGTDPPPPRRWPSAAPGESAPPPPNLRPGRPAAACWPPRCA
jgi:prolipoprotein diacylglyceryltransferase